MTLSHDESSCCCAGCGHDRHTVYCCPGWFINSETGRVERCDECAVFGSDEMAVKHCREWSLIPDDYKHEET